MREILFRGKRKDGCGWIKGYYIFRKIWESDVHIIRTVDNGFDSYTEFEVLPETVGQYTGLTDKNDKKIFEGDIVHLYVGEHSISRYKGIDYNALVIFRDGGFCAIDGTEEDYALRRYNFVSQNLYCEVIGNIHDNPELLKEADNE